MISVDRRSVPSPLNPDLVAAARTRIHDFYMQPPEIRNKQKLDLKERSIIQRQAREGLVQLFRNKCGYCESELGTTSPGDIDLFRPYRDASNLSGDGSPDHYGWLAAEWGNLYIACPACNRAKRSFFPVENERAEVLMPLEKVRQVEHALLVDPCFDDPAKHLRFTEAGHVEALSHKGEVTIKVINLNRPGLVKARLDVWRLTLATAYVAERESDIQALALNDRPYAAVAREAIRAAKAAKQVGGPQPFYDPITRTAHRQIRSADQILASDAEAFRLTARPLRKVEIKNFRAIRDLSLDFGEPSSERAPWLMLLGENATGKSTVLQAIAMALAGADEVRRFTRPAKILSVGAFEGSIVIWFWDHEAPVQLRFHRNEDQFQGTRGPSAIVLGYGSLRHAERRSRRNERGPRFSRIAPIMQPIARIAYPGAWLLSLDEKLFETAARALGSILPVGAESIMLRSGNRIYFDIDGHRATLGELSAGYQTIVGMCADIMRHLFERWDTLASATGIVLIDEIDSHLHPQWTMRIVNALRDAFPQVQFVASTHNPLALRGLRNGEVALLRRDTDSSVVCDQNLPALEGMQVDQLLTSRVFGLESTLDPDTEALLDEYYHLMSLPAEPERFARIAEIRDRVADREALGRSETERMMLQVTNEFVHSSADDTAAAQPLREQTLQQLREIAERGASSRQRRQR